MRQFIGLTVVGSVLSAGLLLSSGAQAEMISSVPLVQVDAMDDTGCGEPLSGGELHELTGGQGQNFDIKELSVQAADVDLNSPIQDPIINGNTTTGIISIGHGAFSNINGIAPVIQNSGNQVTINSAITINLYMD